MGIGTVSWPERAVFVLLCVATAAAPMLAYFTIHELPDAPAGRWFDTGVYVSWAFLIYFSWACLPDLDLPARKRLVAWASFVALELAYPIVSWLLEGGARQYVFADLASYFSTSLALAVSALIFGAGARMVRGGDWGILAALAVVAFFVVWPGLAVEWDWWQAVELPHGDVISQVLRALGAVAGTTGVYRNLRGSSLFGD